MPPGKVIHFIWAGGDAPKLDPFIAYRKARPDSELVLWVDGKLGSPGKLDEFRQHGITVKDIGEHAGIAAPPVVGMMGYMQEPLRPNYGAASDMVRYAVLNRFGGMYADTDVAPGNGSNDACLATAMQPYANALVKAVSTTKK